MIKRTISIILAALMLISTAAIMTSCGEESEYPVKIGKITIEKEPKKIVILDKNLADIISAIGYDVKMVGRSDEVNQKGLEVVPSMGTAQDPSVTQIKKEKTDIVFADSSLNEADVAKLKKSGITVAQFDEAHTMKQLSSLYEKIGRLLGGNITGKDKANEAYKDIKSTLKAVETAAKKDRTIATIAYLYTDNGVLKTVNDGTWCSTLLSYTGSINVFANADSDVVDIKKLLLANPTYLFVADKKVEKYLDNSDVLKKLDALANRTYVIPYDELTLQGYTALDVVKDMIDDITGKADKSAKAEENDE